MKFILFSGNSLDIILTFFLLNHEEYVYLKRNALLLEEISIAGRRLALVCARMKYEIPRTFQQYCAEDVFLLVLDR